MKLRHVSASDTVVLGRKLTTFGAVLEATDAEWAAMQGARMPALIPDAEFAAAGITDDELKKFANSNSWTSPDARDFVGKVQLTWASLAKLQKAAIDAQPAAPAPEAPAAEGQPATDAPSLWAPKKK